MERNKKENKKKNKEEMTKKNPNDKLSLTFFIFILSSQNVISAQRRWPIQCNSISYDFISFNHQNKTRCQSFIQIEKMRWNFISAIMNVASLGFWPFIRRKNFFIVWLSVVLFTSDIHQINGEPNKSCK